MTTYACQHQSSFAIVKEMFIVLYMKYSCDCIQQPAIITVIAIICLQHIWTSTQTFHIHVIFENI